MTSEGNSSFKYNPGIW